MNSSQLVTIILVWFISAGVHSTLTYFLGKDKGNDDVVIPFTIAWFIFSLLLLLILAFNLINLISKNWAQ